MIKFLHLFKNYYLGISFIGIAAFVIQEIPYIVMPLIKPASNPIMNMQNEMKWIETVQGIFGILSMILLMLIVRDDVKLIPRETTKEKTFLFLMILMILINFIGWILYYMCKFRLNGTAVPRQRRGHSVLNGAKRRLVDSYSLYRFPHALSVHL